MLYPITVAGSARRASVLVEDADVRYEVVVDEHGAMSSRLSPASRQVDDLIDQYELQRMFADLLDQRP